MKFELVIMMRDDCETYINTQVSQNIYSSLSNILGIKWGGGSRSGEDGEGGYDDDDNDDDYDNDAAAENMKNMKQTKKNNNREE